MGPSRLAVSARYMLRILDAKHMRVKVGVKRCINLSMGYGAIAAQIRDLSAVP
jgi:hypothetical protein